LVGRDIAGVDEMCVGQKTFGIEPLMNLLQSVTINDGRWGGLYMGDL